MGFSEVAKRKFDSNNEVPGDNTSSILKQIIDQQLAKKLIPTIQLTNDAPKTIFENAENISSRDRSSSRERRKKKKKKKRAHYVDSAEPEAKTRHRRRSSSSHENLR